MTIEIQTLSVTSLQQNCRILLHHDESGERQALVVDPGGNSDQILSALQAADATLSAIWLTHSHLDHCGGVADLLESRTVPLVGHAAETEYRQRVEDICQSYGIPSGEMKNCPEPTQFVKGGETLHFAGGDFEVRFVPGHSPGHVVFYCAEENVLLAGDTLFAGSIGRTDLPGGNHEQLLERIKEEIYTLPEATRVLPGHGPETTVGEEMKNNPFVRA